MEKLHRKLEWIDLLSLIGLCLSVILIYFAWQGGVFNSREDFVAYVHGFGRFSVAIFILLQILQIFLPLLPSALTVTAGVILYGSFIGVLYNYIGISIGSILAFLIVRRYGHSALEKLVSQNRIQKYEDKLKNGKTFERFFTTVIFLPFAPDNVVCYLAGLSNMSVLKVSVIILLGKPLSIALYSLGWTILLELIGII